MHSTIGSADPRFVSIMNIRIRTSSCRPFVLISDSSGIFKRTAPTQRLSPCCLLMLFVGINLSIMIDQKLYLKMAIQEEIPHGCRCCHRYVECSLDHLLSWNFASFNSRIVVLFLLLILMLIPDEQAESQTTGYSSSSKKWFASCCVVIEG